MLESESIPAAVLITAEIYMNLAENQAAADGRLLARRPIDLLHKQQIDYFENELLPAIDAIMRPAAARLLAEYVRPADK